MSYDLREYLELAEEILKLSEASIGEDNAYVRCSISRAYYSVFSIARNMKGLKFFLSNKEGNYETIHSVVLEAYRTSQGRTRKSDREVWRYLDALRRLRVDADYYEDRMVRKIDVENGIEKAKLCLKTLTNTYGENYDVSPIS